MDELKAFMGMILWMGMIKAPTLESYWSDEKWFKIEAFQRIMSRERFLKILHHLHLADNEDEDAATDRLAKFRPFLDMANNSSQSTWMVTQIVSIDEAVAPFTGRLMWKQYMPDKPEKWGMKIFKLCDSRGFMFNFDVYTGADEDKEESESTIDSLVLRLTEQLHGEYPYHLFCDNFYSSIPLAKKLLSKKIYFTGTLRENRKYIPKVLRDFKVQHKGECAWIAGKDGLVLVKLFDTKVVYFVSTAHTGCEPMLVDRSDGAGGKKQTYLPKMVAEYNQHMGTVDSHNQSCSYYSYGRRCSKWWQALFFYTLSALVVNAWIIFKVTNPKKNVGLLEYQQLICEHLIGDFTSRVRSNTTVDGEFCRVLKCGHHVVKIQGSRKRVCGICKVGAPSLRCQECDFPIHEQCINNHP